MREKVKEVPEKFKEFWNKYTSKQKNNSYSYIMCCTYCNRSCRMACFKTDMVKVSGV